ncbi:glycosyltransferase family 2 protein [Chlorobaculum sp. 24CR]|uniref:glycosyltransferase family 2 protein n=1 Tax=Chlorobaculum sp. 24CR TaxID=2508878 RepID=UPI00100BA5FD|nr:glycosyltransferase family 2 protein [Chlorobaculum sp. 24CR]RXK88287.1 glycosyltransferase family 2 protein [Chlorobaculum sp. 24CR]
MQASSKTAPAVTVIIPHLRNRPMLDACLDALRKTTFRDFSVLVVDNGGEDSDLAALESRYPDLAVLRLPANAGYAGGCNAGLKLATSRYVVFLNDDTVVEPEWLGCLVAAAESDPAVGALQPKILSLPERRQGRRVFDYAGAAGGLFDRLGFPYCLGRSFGGREVDAGQYDHPRDIFWASGVALFARREAVERLGGFEESFFMHMEEIDLCWRMSLVGYRVRSAPQSVAWHEGGASLAEGSPLKVYYNHRNALLTLLRNRSAAPLIALLPLRLALEAAALLYYLAGGKEGMARAAQVARAFIDVLWRLPETLRQRRSIQRARTVGDRELFRHAPLSIFLPRRPA